MSSESHVFNDQDASAIRALTDIHVRAVLDHDPNAFLAACTEDITLIPPEQPAFAGREACRSFLQEFPKPTTFTAKIDDVEGQGRLGFSRGSATATFVDGGATTFRWMAIHRKGSDGTWKMARDIWNTYEPG